MHFRSQRGLSGGSRNAAAQARYRERHAADISATRRLANALLYHDDIEALADILLAFLSEEDRRELIKHLRRA